MMTREGKQLEMELMKMVSIMLELATGKEPPRLPIIVSYDKALRLIVFRPWISPVDYKKLEDKHKAEEAALRKA